MRYVTHVGDRAGLLFTDEKQLIQLLFKVRINPKPFILPEFDYTPIPYLPNQMLMNRAKFRLLN